MLSFTRGVSNVKQEGGLGKGAGDFETLRISCPGGKSHLGLRIIGLAGKKKDRRRGGSGGKSRRRKSDTGKGGQRSEERRKSAIPI